MSERKSFSVSEQSSGNSVKYKNSSIPILSGKELDERYPDGGYVIEGVLGDSTEEKDIEGSLSYSDHVFTVLNTACRPKKGAKRLAGYVSVGENRYLEVYRTNLLPIFLIGAAVAAAAVAAVVTLSGPKSQPATAEKETKAKLALEEGQQDFVEQKDDTPKVRNIVMPGWSTLTIAADTTEITRGVDFFNPDKNLWYTCPDCGNDLDSAKYCANCKKMAGDAAVEDCFYMTFALCLTENDEVLYQSGLVAPGKHLQSITLTRALPAGEYDAYVFIQPYKSDMATPCNNGVVKLNLIVK